MTVVAIANDHAGPALKTAIIRHIEALGHSVLNLGTDTDDSVDYPDYADALAAAMKNGKAELGILICGTGIGIGIAANRHRQIRAAVCSSAEMAQLAREHNNANVLALGARITDEATALACVDAFLSTQFSGGERHLRRVGKLS